MDVRSRIIRRVKLHDVVDGGDIQATRGDIRADENTLGGVAEFEERVGALLLFHLAVQGQHGQVNVVQQLRVIFDRVAAGKENDELLLEVLLQEGKQEQEALVRFAENVALLDAFHRAVLLAVVHVDVQRPGLQRDARKIFDLVLLATKLGKRKVG